MNNNINNNIKNENQKLKDELNNCKKENEKLKIEINKLKTENAKLNNDLIKSQKIISNFISQNNNIGNNNNIKNLNDLIKMKDNLINDLMLQLQNNSGNNKLVNFDKIMIVNFFSLDQKINCGIKCIETETFAEVEEKLYQKYGEYRETNNKFVAKGKIVLRFKKLCENDIKDGDIIQLINIE